MTNRLCTPPSRVTPSGWNLNRASRTGPFASTNDGTSFRAPPSVAIATSGLTAGARPPHRGLGMTAPARVEIEARTEPIWHGLVLLEVFQARIEEAGLSRCQPCDRC